MEKPITGLGGGVQPVETTKGSDPQRPGAVLQNALDLAVAETGGIANAVPEDSKLVSVVAIESILGPEPMHPRHLLF